MFGIYIPGDVRKTCMIWIFHTQVEYLAGSLIYVVHKYIC